MPPRRQRLAKYIVLLAAVVIVVASALGIEVWLSQRRQTPAAGTGGQGASTGVFVDFPAGLPDRWSNSLRMQFIRIPAGEFTMGTPLRAVQHLQQHYPKDPFSGQVAHEAPAHRVRITRDFMMAKFETTVDLFRRFVHASGYVTEAERNGPGAYLFTAQSDDHSSKAFGTWRTAAASKGDNLPITCVSFNDARKFATWLNQAVDRPRGYFYRLPTEAEWEYAARGPANLSYPWGNQWADSRCNFADVRSGRRFLGRGIEPPILDDGFARTAPVGSYSPRGDSPFGIADLAGNVFEWCYDVFDGSYYQSSATEDPVNPATAGQRVCRGGSWVCFPVRCRGAFRIAKEASFSSNYVGFRLVLAPEGVANRAPEP